MVNSQELTNPRPAAILMWLTYVFGGAGCFIGGLTLQQDPPSLSLAALLAVTATGVLSFIRHSIYNRSDAVHGGWDYGRRNNFQIEVGLANLAWALFAFLAVVLDWGLMAVASSFVISGFYFFSVMIFVIVTPGAHQRGLRGIIGIAVWSLATTLIGLWGISLA